LLLSGGKESSVNISIVVDGSDETAPESLGPEDLVIVQVSGELDTSTSDQLESAMAQQVERGARRIILDLQAMDYVSSVGLRVFLFYLKRLRASDGQLVLSGLNEEVQEIFDMAGFTPLFAIAPTLEDARASLQ
jgi:anti-sigma B factor antagonist